MASKNPETPKGTKVFNSSSNSETPFVITSSSQADSSAKKQRNLKQAMKEELGDRVYESNKLLNKIFNTSLPQDLGKVTEDCINKFEEFPFPNSGNERAYYVSFVNRLNIVKESLKRNGLMEESVYKDVLFEIYDAQMKEGTGKDAPLQPDIIARVRSASKETKDQISWMDVEFCVEVKGQYAEMVAQGATYARSIMAAQRSRYFVLIIFYEQMSANVSFGLFTPAWLCLSPKINIETAEGQRQFIWDMARIWSCKSRWSAGFDLTCNNTTCYLEKYGTFSIHEKLFHRISVAGRQTRVDIITDGKVSDVQTDNSHSGIVVYGLHEYTSNGSSTTTPENSGSRTQSSGTRRSARLLEKAKSRPASALPALSPKTPSHTNRPCDLPVSIRSPPLHKKLILKDSWPILSREKREEEVFGEVGSKFGVPKILGSFAVKIQKDNGEAVKSDTTWFFPDDATKLRLWRTRSNQPDGISQSSNQKNKNKNEGPEHRVHVRLLIQTEGRPLYQAKGPRQLLQAVLHAMIGYWVILEKGWLHRDVSSGNVLLMETPERRGIIEGFEDILTEDILKKYFDKCVGFISDGDQAVQWENMSRETAKQRSGTPPFMSLRLISAEITKERVPHSAIDDLESFVWVLFSNILRAMEFHGVRFSKREEHYRFCLQSINLDTLDRRSGFERTLEETALDIQTRQKVANQQTKESRTPALSHQQSKKFSTPALPNQQTEQSDALTNQQPGEIPGVSFAFEPFVGILLEWLSFGRKLALVYRNNPTSANYPQSLKPQFEKYLEIGITHLKDLEDTWEYINGPPKTISSTLSGFN